MPQQPPKLTSFALVGEGNLMCSLSIPSQHPKNGPWAWNPSLPRDTEPAHPCQADNPPLLKHMCRWPQTHPQHSAIQTPWGGVGGLFTLGKKGASRPIALQWLSGVEGALVAMGDLHTLLELTSLFLPSESKALLHPVLYCALPSLVTLIPRCSEQCLDFYSRWLAL